jgi:hypothetical protein
LNTQEHLLAILIEEAGEIMTDILTDQNFEYECTDFIAVTEILEDHSILEKNIVDFTIDKNKCNSHELVLTLLKLQYFITKSLRFGLFEHHHETKIKNIVEIESLISKSITIIKNLDEIDFEMVNNTHLKERKKKKVMAFMNFSRINGSLID